MIKSIRLTTDLDQSKEEILVPNEQGLYKIDLTWRYILKAGIVLDTILHDAGLEYVRRPPGEFYELWRSHEIISSESDSYYDAFPF